jgi:hypothetical protein
MWHVYGTKEMGIGVLVGKPGERNRLENLDAYNRIY